MDLRNKLKEQLNTPAITKKQQQLLAAGIAVANGTIKIALAFVLFFVMVFAGHYSGFESFVQGLLGVK